MKVCDGHRKTAGLPLRQLEIVPIEQCELCRMSAYFNSENPANKSPQEVALMRRKYELDQKAAGTFVGKDLVYEGELAGKVIDAVIENKGKHRKRRKHR